MYESILTTEAKDSEWHVFDGGTGRLSMDKIPVTNNRESVSNVIEGYHMLPIEGQNDVPLYAFFLSRWCKGVFLAEWKVQNSRKYGIVEQNVNKNSYSNKPQDDRLFMLVVPQDTGINNQINQCIMSTN